MAGSTSGRARRVVQLSTVHVPTDTRIQKQCRTLAAAGYDVILVATASSRDVPSSVPLEALPRPSSRPRRMLVSTVAAYRTARDLRADVYHFHDPELMPVGLALRRRGSRVVYDVHEDYPAEMRSKDWIAPRLRVPVSRSFDVLERALCRRFDLLIAATPSIAARFQQTNSVVVQNFPELGELAEDRPAPMAQRARVVAYVGDVTAVRGAHEMIAGCARVTPGVTLEIAGPVNPPELLSDLERQAQTSHVRFLGRQLREEVRSLLGRARAGLVLFHPTPNHIAAQPNKLFEYMAAGLPVVASDFPLWRDIVDGARAGILVDPLDTDAIARAVSTILNDPDEAEAMGRRGREAVETTFNWGREGAALVEAYDALFG